MSSPLAKAMSVPTCHDFMERILSTIKNLLRLSAKSQGKRVTNSQLAIAWVLAKGQNIVPVVGARKRTQLQEALGSLDIMLSAEDLARIERTVPVETVAGKRYDPRLMAMLDSERAT